MKERLIGIGLKLLVVPVFALLCYQSVDTKKLLERKWRMDEQSVVPSLKQRIKTLKKTDPERAKQIEENFDGATETVRVAVYEYHPDGTYSIRIMIASEKQTWELQADNKTIIMKSERIGTLEKTIVLLNQDKMILKDKGDPDAPEILFLPAE